MRFTARIAVVAATLFASAALASAQAPAAYNPPPGATPFPTVDGYSWTFRDPRGNLHDVRCVQSDSRTGRAILHNLSGKGEYVETERTVDRYNQPVVNAREQGGRAPMALWGKLFQSVYPWTWTGTDDVTLRGRRRSTWYRSAIEPAGTFLRPLVYDIGPAPGVADAGISQIVLEPGVGLLEQTFDTIAGPVSWELESAKTAAGQLPAALYAVQTSLTLDPPSFTYPGILPAGTGGYRPPRITATFEAKVRPGSGRVIPLTFMGGQRAELEIYDAENRLVYKWSEGRAFTKEIRYTALTERAPIRFVFQDVPMPSAIMDPLGRYRFRAYVTDAPAAPTPRKRFSAQELMRVMAGV